VELAQQRVDRHELHAQAKRLVDEAAQCRDGGVAEHGGGGQALLGVVDGLGRGQRRGLVGGGGQRGQGPERARRGAPLVAQWQRPAHDAQEHHLGKASGEHERGQSQRLTGGSAEAPEDDDGDDGLVTDDAAAVAHGDQEASHQRP
jgi:hypothetical protein